MTHYLYLASEKGVFIARREDGNWHTIREGLRDQFVTSIVVCGNLILAGTTEGIWRSVDRGETWHSASAGMQTP